MFTRRYIRRVSCWLLIVGCGNPFPLFAQQPQDRTLVPVAKPNTTAQPTGPRAQRPELVLQTGVTEPAAVAAFSPDGRLLATLGLTGKAVKLWELASGRELAVLNVSDSATMTFAHSADLAFSADGKMLTTFVSGSVKQWDVQTARRLRSTPLFASQFGMELVRVSPGGRYVAAWFEQQRALQVWEVENGRQIFAINKTDDEPGAETNSLAFNADGSLLVTCVSGHTGMNDLDSQLIVRETATGRVIQTIKTTENAAKKENEKALRDQQKAQQKAMMDMMRGKGSGQTPTMPMGAMGNAKTVEPLRTVRVSPDGRWLALGIYDQARQVGLNATPVPSPVIVKLYEMKSGREMATINVAPPTVPAESYAQYVENHLAFSPDGKWLAAISPEMTVKLCETATGRVTTTLGGHKSPIIALGFSADGRSLATAGYDNLVIVHDLVRTTVAHTFGHAGQPIGSLSFAADGRALITGGTQSVNLWETNTGLAVRTITLDSTPPRNRDELYEKAGNTTLSADGQFFAAPSGKGAVKVWDTRTGREVRNVALTPARRLKQLALNQDGSQLMLSEAPLPDGSAAADDAPPAKSQPVIQQPMTLGGLSGGPGGKPDKKKIEQMQKQADEMQKLASSGQIGKAMEMMQQMTGNLGLGSMMPAMAAGQAGAGVRFFDLKQTGEPRVLRNAKPGLAAFEFNLQSAFSADGRFAAVAWSGASVKLNDAVTAREISSIALDRSMNIQQIAFSPDARKLAVIAMETRAGVNFNQTNNLNYDQMMAFNLHLYDITTASAPRELRALTLPSWGSSLAFSPDGSTLAVGSEVIKLYDLASGRELQSLSGHALVVNALAFSPDGKLLFSGGEDGSTKLWDVQAGALLATLVTMNGGGDWLVVTPDGLFDGTPAAWRQILWRFSANIDDVSPVEVYFNEFFTPGLLAEFFRGKRPRATQDVSLKDRRQPLVALRTADGQTTSANRNVTVRLDISEPATSQANNPVGARDVRLFRNGTLVKVWRGDVLQGQRQTTLEATLPIVAGENRLTAYAFNRDNIKSTDAALTLTGSEALRRKGTVYVLACGVNRYANEQFNLKYAVADATSFGNEVRAQQTRLQQYERIEIVSLLDAEVTRANLLLALKRLGSNAALPANAPAALQKLQPAQPEDAVVLYFAGHGIAAGSHFYLIPHDLGYSGARAALDERGLQTILQRSVSDLDLESVVETIDAGQMLCVIDACNSGQALESEEQRRGPMNSKGLAQLAYEKGMSILTAAQSYQAALETAQLGHGYLTFALVEEGLKLGAADRDAKDGQIITREWFDYAAARVPQMQEGENQARKLAKIQLVPFVSGEEKNANPNQRSIQRPRVFYRRELETNPFIVAKP